MIGERVARFGTVERNERDAVPDFAQQLAGSGVDFDPTFCHFNHSRFDAAEAAISGVAIAGRSSIAKVHATFNAALLSAPRNPASRSRMMRSASAMMRSINSLTVGTSLINPTTMPQLQAPASISPSIMTLG